LGEKVPPFLDLDDQFGLELLSGPRLLGRLVGNPDRLFAFDSCANSGEALQKMIQTTTKSLIRFRFRCSNNKDCLSACQ